MTIVETVDCGEGGINSIAMTIINPRKEYWPNRRFEPASPGLKTLQPTELWCVAAKVLRNHARSRSLYRLQDLHCTLDGLPERNQSAVSTVIGRH